MIRGRSCATAIWGGIALWAWASVASANGRPSALDDYGEDALPAAVELEVGGTVHDGKTALAGSLAGRVAVTTSLDVTAELPAGWIDGTEPAGRDGALVGNPLVGVFHVQRARDRDSYLRVGGALALPASGADTTLLGDDTGSALLLGANGAVDPWMFESGATTFVLSVRTEGRRGVRVLGVDFAIAVWLDEPRYGTRVQLRPWAGIRLADVTLGLELPLVWAPFFGGGYISAVPFVQAALSRHVFVFTRFVLNLDEPLGLTGNGAGLWGAFLGGGIRF